MLIGFAVILVLPVIVVAFIAYRFGDSLLKPPPSPRNEKPATPLPLTPVEFDGESGRLRGWLILQPGSEKRPAILLTHGWGRNAEQMLPYAEFLYQDGYHLCLFDVRNHGNSDVDSYVSIFRYSNDIIAAARWLASRPEVDANRLGHLGHSMGAASSLRAARVSGLFRCLVFSSGFADLRDLTAWMLQARKLPVEPFSTLILKFWEHRLRISLAEVNPIANIAQLNIPVLLAHGEKDQIVPASQMSKLAAYAVNRNTQTLLVPGHQHSNLHGDPQYVKAVRDFFASYL
ncbi:MAG: alpha/beta fold hydrolase [candidate division KSB1 bacterium]|nr:alpha/beta fold hydrolase [candidate division KSB1 bacterium]MDZ7304681.1 alpha/beta fold hydrolase [candidate division KSB1 bacterium]MDZ7313787.1 alpha/beta fold hydrolase [candidate division KSB1 bacterium]